MHRPRRPFPAISKYVFTRVDPGFPERAAAAKGGIVVGGDNYGRGSSREHAVLAPRYLGLRAVIAKSYARIHHDNLINFGILPLRFADPADAARVDQGDRLSLNSVDGLLDSGHGTLTDVTKGTSVEVTLALSDRQKEILRAGGLLNHTSASSKARKAAA